MKSKFFLIAAALPLSSCAQWLDPPQSIGDINAGYRYVPVDPLPVSFTNDLSACVAPAGTTPGLMNALPNLASRVATEDTTAEASVTVPAVTAGGSGRSYRVTQDFIIYDTATLRFEVPSDLLGPDQMTPASRPPPASLARVRALDPDENPSGTNQVIAVPVYVGVGLRLTANLQIRAGKVNLTDLGAISGAVSANRVQGGLVSQLLGLGGTRASAMAPGPGELNPTTIQAAAVAMGQIRAIVYDAGTQRWPQVVGIHYPFARVNPALVNAIQSELARHPIAWHPCSATGQRLQLL
jgi:hypothetical protein